VRLIDAARCPYCARVRLALAEKELEYETVEVDLSDRPQWLLDLNPPSGRVSPCRGLRKSLIRIFLLPAH